MAESLAERLKRIAAEKKAAAAAQVAEPIAEVVKNVESGISDSAISVVDTAVSVGNGQHLESQGQPEIHSEQDVAVMDSGVSGSVNSGSEISTISELTTRPDHPLAMQFAELEAALLARDPEFKLILRQVHQHLGKDAELVTMMTEEEVALVVGGLVLFANTEIVEPAKAKGVKKAVAEAKKKTISADDL